MENNTESIGRRGYRVIGCVQRVGFRWWTRRAAEKLGLYGSVRNLPDGSVEVQVAGGINELAEFEESLRYGPLGARVDILESIEPAAECLSDAFRIDL